MRAAITQRATVGSSIALSAGTANGTVDTPRHESAATSEPLSNAPGAAVPSAASSICPTDTAHVHPSGGGIESVTSCARVGWAKPIEIRLPGASSRTIGAGPRSCCSSVVVQSA